MIIVKWGDYMDIKYAMACPYFPEEDIEWIINNFRSILEGKGMLSMGKYVRIFEEQFSEYIGAKYAIAVNSCTGALEIALRTIGINDGDEVIIPVEAFIADASCIIREKGIPVFAEIEPDTLCISLEDIEKKVTSRTKAVIVVYMAGLVPPDIFEIRNFCRSKGIYLIEDASHAHGASINGIKAGAIGNISCFSFGSTKIMAAGEAGMLLMDDETLYKKANGYRNRGLDIEASCEMYSTISSNYRLTEVNALMGLAQLKRVNEFVRHRNNIAEIYQKSLKGLNDTGKITLLSIPQNTIHSYWRFILKLNEGIDRAKVKEHMRKYGITVDWAYSPLLHLQPALKNKYPENGTYKHSEAILGSHICLPIHTKISESDASFIAQKLIEYIKKLDRKD